MIPILTSCIIDLGLTKFYCYFLSVHECRNLPAMDTNGLADPYVVVSHSYSGATSAFQQKSERRENTLNPNFEENFFL